MLTRLGAVVFMTPMFLIPGFFVGLFGGWVGRIYMAAQLSVKREMSNAKAPVVGQLVEILLALLTLLTLVTASVLQFPGLVRSTGHESHSKSNIIVQRPSVLTEPKKPS